VVVALLFEELHVLQLLLGRLLVNLAFLNCYPALPSDSHACAAADSDSCASGAEHVLSALLRDSV
jgi:hypothetical protein